MSVAWYLVIGAPIVIFLVLLFSGKPSALCLGARLASKCCATKPFVLFVTWFGF